ncbi:DNA-protecting protein DprA [Ruania alkalisoli]|uniref:DNA-protecting protein DprA n=1 Tax=Ruania alkalisoli TaxID=2779775 RepID=A0A7M1SNP4_9MICO|nr:DNA-processing protein DprA [Ruania alkalisoli]QOR69179.1 DNA-protecting protein DprA [Ruania alkalisoli]
MATMAEQVAGERMARMVLSMIAEPDDSVTGHVLARFGGVETLRLVESDDPIPDLERADAMLWREHLRVNLTADLFERVAAPAQRGIGTLIPSDDHWPTGLNDLGVLAPYVLWTRGATSLLRSPLRERVTITGARSATAYGLEITSDLAANLADDERVIISGGGFGIDGAAHRGTLPQGGHTVAVLACGVDRAYPSAHRDMLEQIGDVGLLVSELPPGTVPARQRFLARGRLLAATSGATVVPEAAPRSGALYVASRAHLLGRAVAAVPGPVTSIVSQGPHELIKQGQASLATETSDITRLLDSGPARRQRAGTLELGYRPDREPPSSGRLL